jgi:hypothetical protein
MWKSVIICYRNNKNIGIKVKDDSEYEWETEK